LKFLEHSGNAEDLRDFMNSVNQNMKETDSSKRRDLNAQCHCL